MHMAFMVEVEPEKESLNNKTPVPYFRLRNYIRSGGGAIFEMNISICKASRCYFEHQLSTKRMVWYSLGRNVNTRKMSQVLEERFLFHAWEISTNGILTLRLSLVGSHLFLRCLLISISFTFKYPPFLRLFS